MIAVNFDRREFLYFDRALTEYLFKNDVGRLHYSSERLVYLLTHSWFGDRVLFIEATPPCPMVPEYSSILEEFSFVDRDFLYSYIINLFSPALKGGQPCDRYVCNSILKEYTKCTERFVLPVLLHVGDITCPQGVGKYLSRWTQCSEGVFFSNTIPEGFKEI